MTDKPSIAPPAPKAKPTARDRPGYVWFGKGQPAELVTQLVEGVYNAGVAYWLSYRADRPHFWYYDVDDAQQQVALWPQGRVFGSELEVRWEKRDGAYASWILTEDEKHLEGLADAGFQPVGNEWTAVEHDRAPAFLWGRYDRRRGAWVEVQIPNPQPYPATPPAADEKDTEKLFARLRVVYYRTVTGAVQFTRLKGVT